MRFRIEDTLFIIIILGCCCLSCKQGDQTGTNLFEIERISLGTHASLRGLHVISDSTWWISGSEGMAAHVSISDEGASLQALAGYDSKDFRDIHGWDDHEAIVLSVGDSAIFLKTIDRWQTWDTTLYDSNPGVFIDAFDFDGDYGVAYGDALDGVLYIQETHSAGRGWNKIPANVLPPALPREGGFAASGTNVKLTDQSVYIVTGAGSYPRWLKRTRSEVIWQYGTLPLQSGGETHGAYSVTFANDQFGIVAGGSFRDSTRNDSVMAVTSDAGVTWQVLPPGAVSGFRSCVAYSPKLQLFIATGRTGVDYSSDGYTWHSISTESGFYACGFGDSCAILVGRGGKCAVIEFMHK